MKEVPYTLFQKNIKVIKTIVIWGSEKITYHLV